MSKADMPNGRTIFNNNKKTFKNCPETDLIKKTRLDVLRSYGKTFPCKSLLNRLSTIEFLLKHRFGIVSSFMMGFVVSSIVALFTDYIYNWGNSEDSNLGLKALLLLIIIVLCFISITPIYASAYDNLKKFHNDTYSLFILPYERHIIINKLKEEHSFTYENFDIPPKRCKRSKRKI